MKKKLILLFAFIALGILSCTTDYEILKSYESIVLTADSSSRVIGENITFTVTNSDGDVLTDDAVIYVDGAAIEGNTFTSAVAGSHVVKAKYENAESEPLTIEFTAVPQVLFRKRVLIEDYTGTWCGYCPRVSHAIDLVMNLTPDAVAVAIHRPSSNSSSPVYDPYNYDSSELESTLGAEGYPKGFLNRKIQWINPEPANVSQAVNLTQGENPRLGLAMTSSVGGGNITLDVKTKFSRNFTNLKLVVYVLENGLVYNQYNYTEYYNGDDIIVNYQHNHVLRSCLTPILGQPIDNSQTVDTNIYTKSFSVPVPANVANVNNIEFVAFIVDQNGNAINVRKAAPGDSQVFEELP